MNLSYEQIKAFVAVAEIGSFSSAAKQLGKHRTTLGQVISNLEVEVNMDLFDRTGRYPVLTEEGHALYQHAKNLAETMTSFERLCMDTEQGIEDQVTICSSELTPLELITDVMRGLRDKYPRVKVNWLHKGHEEVKVAFAEGTADLALMLVPTGNAISSIEYIYLINMPFVFCATPSFIEACRLSDLLSLKQTKQLMMGDYHSAGITKMLTISNIAQRIESLSVMKQLLLNEDGWAVLPRHCVDDELKRGRLQEIHVNAIHANVQLPISLWHRKSIAGPATREIMRLLKEHSSKYSH